MNGSLNLRGSKLTNLLNKLLDTTLSSKSVRSNNLSGQSKSLLNLFESQSNKNHKNHQANSKKKSKKKIKKKRNMIKKKNLRRVKHQTLDRRLLHLVRNSTWRNLV